MIESLLNLLKRNLEARFEDIEVSVNVARHMSYDTYIYIYSKHSFFNIEIFHDTSAGEEEMALRIEIKGDNFIKAFSFSKESRASSKKCYIYFDKDTFIVSKKSNSPYDFLEGPDYCSVSLDKEAFHLLEKILTYIFNFYSDKNLFSKYGVVYNREERDNTNMFKLHNGDDWKSHCKYGYDQIFNLLKKFDF